MSRIFVSLNLKPSFSMAARMSGRSCLKSELMRMFPLGRVDQVHGQVGRADVIEVPCDLEGGKFPMPVGIGLCHETGGENQGRKRRSSKHIYSLVWLRQRFRSGNAM